MLHATDVANQGRIQDAEAILGELLRTSDMALEESDITVVRNLLDIAGTLLGTGHFGALENVYLKVIPVLARHRQAGIADTFVPLNNLAALYDRAGAYGKRDQINSIIIAKAEQLSEPIDDRTMMVIVPLAQLYKSSGQAKPTAILYRPAYRYALSNPLGAEVRLSIIRSFGDALVADGRARDAFEMYGESLAHLDAMPGFTEDQRMTLLFLRGSSAKAAGGLIEAEKALKLAEAVAERTQPDSPDAGVIYHTLATLYLDLRLHYDEAERLLEHAAKIAAKTVGETSAEYAGSLTQLAVVVDAKGNSERAESLYREAFRIYEAAPVPKPAEHADFLTDAGGLYMRLHRYDDALAIYSQAYRLREAIPNLSTSVRANTIANLATAYFELGDLPEAIKYYREAVNMRFQSVSV
jgi:tetratricopeptide (TPR) repeat protein